MVEAFPAATFLSPSLHRGFVEASADVRRMWDEAFPPRRPRAPGVSDAAVPLTPREVEVLRLVAQGRSNAEISASLAIAGATAARHVSNIFDKLNVHNRAMATDAAHRLGLLG
jgi:ATP/maltotriose-dependent transcriptional regulator MalT